MEYHRKLPHFDHIGLFFFITFRLFNSIPVHLARQLRAERDREQQKARTYPTQEQQQAAKIKAQNNYFRKIEAHLDHPTFGDRFLDTPSCTNIIAQVLQEYHNEYYYLHAFCIMPNHVHVLIDTAQQIPINKANFDIDQYQYLYQIMRRIKGKSGLYINRERKTNGSVWLPESYDRYIRGQKHYNYTLNYIIQNPVKAGLVTDWTKWSGTYVNNSIDNNDNILLKNR
jgi:putative transposase